MTSVNLTQLSGGTTKIANETLAALRTRVRGAVLITGDEGYDTARTVWNAMVDRKPGLIVRCAGPADVQATVDFARNTGAVLSVHGGGHNIAGTEVLIFATCYAGAVAEGEKATRALRALGRAIADVVSPHQFVGWQAAFDPLLTPGARNYWKSHDFVGLSDGAIDAILAGVHALPSPECEVFIAHVGGAMARIAADATAWPNRQAHFVMNAHGRWRDQDQDTRCIAWARKLSQSTAPFAMGSVYINFMPEDEADRIEKAYGENYLRLAEIKRRYDPDNLFRVNQNVRPARAAVEETAS